MTRIVNCTVLSNFAAAQQLPLLRAMAGPLYLPVEVHAEIVAGQLAGYAFYDEFERHTVPPTPDGWLHLVTMTEAELTLALSLPANLHQGKRACLAIARQRGWGFLSDDRDARRQAAYWQIPLSGTLGVLLLAVQEGQLSITDGNHILADHILAEMVRKAQYRSPVQDLRALLP